MCNHTKLPATKRLSGQPTSASVGYHSQVSQEAKFPGKKGISPYIATNKPGTPVTQARVVIFLHDTAPAFDDLKTIILGKTKYLVKGIGGLGARVPIQVRGQRSFVSLPSRGMRGNGGVLFLPSSTKNTIHLLTWNVDTLSLSRNTSNDSHAETQFLNWFKAHVAQYPQFVKRIKAIYIFINNSPCGACTHDLCAFVKRYNLNNKIRISWRRAYTKGTSSTVNLQQLKQCGIIVSSPATTSLQKELKLGNLKLARQQQHTYVLDNRVHQKKSGAINRRAERIINDNQKPASLLSRVFASPHNYVRVKRLFQQVIDQGNYSPRPGGGYQATLNFKFPTGWSYGKQVYRLKAIIDQKGNWHYYPVP